MKRDHDGHDIIDTDLFEDIDDEEMYELVEEARKEALLRAKRKKELREETKRKFPKWAFWLIAIAMVFNLFSLFPQTISIPAIEFLVTSAKLSTDAEVKTYKKSVVVIETENSRGTGFSISSGGKILTNHHVVEGEKTVTVAFPDDGLHTATVTESYPAVDLAVLTIKGKNFPHLELADHLTYEDDELIQFIGNPLQFQGIVNEGTIIGNIQLNNWEKEVIMIQAPVYRGNSGSPIINSNGQVVGVVFATMHHDEHGRIGLFVPIDYYYDYN